MKVMSTKFTILIAAGLFFAVTTQAQGNYDHRDADHARMDTRHDRRDLGHDRMDMRHDRNDIRYDHRDIARDGRDGNFHDFRQDHRDLSRTKGASAGKSPAEFRAVFEADFL